MLIDISALSSIHISGYLPDLLTTVFMAPNEYLILRVLNEHEIDYIYKKFMVQEIHMKLCISHQQPKEKEDKGCGCFPCLRRRKTKKTNVSRFIFLSMFCRTEETFLAYVQWNINSPI
jgi:hypothetical protein